MAKPHLTIVASNMDNLRAQIRQWPSTAAVIAGEELLAELAPFKEEMKRRSTQGPLFKRSGRLGASWVAEVPVPRRLSDVKGSVYALAGYSYIHEFGGQISPPAGKSWFFIPTIYNLKNTGRPRLTVEQVISQGGKFGTPRDVDPLILKNLTYVTRAMVIDKDGFPMFTQIKRATYKPQLEFFARGNTLAGQLPSRMADRLVRYWQAPVL
jgi:hypothetical protein